MRRGLFIASDEVSAYMESIFGDRIQKREAHLRWAAEVTQTVDIDKLKGLPQSPWQNEDGSILTYNSEVQASQPNTARAAPRPAAGMPATEGPASGPPTARPGGLKSTLALGARAPAGIGHVPVPVPRPASLPRPIDPIRSEDPPTLARPRGPGEGRGRPDGASFDDDFDDVGDTIVSDSMPEIDELRRPKTPAMGMTPGLGTTQTRAASPGAMAGAMAVAMGPSAIPPRLPTPPPMPAVMVPQQAARIDVTRTAIADESHLAFPQPLLRPSVSNEYAVPQMHPSPYGMPGHGPADMQRLFAPPARNEQRTITAQALKKRIPVWVVAVGSALIGLIAFGLVVLVLSIAAPRRRVTAPNASSSPGSSSTTAAATAAAPTTPAASPPASPAGSGAPGPFRSAREAFGLAIAAASPPAQTDDSIAPPAPNPPAPRPPPQAIPTTNIASLPTAPPRSAFATHPAVAAATPPSTTAMGNGTLKVICFPGCDQVIDNGSALGPSPIIRRTASVGSHRLKLVWSDASKVVSTVVIADQTATVRENHP